MPGETPSNRQAEPLAPAGAAAAVEGIEQVRHLFRPRAGAAVLDVGFDSRPALNRQANPAAGRNRLQGIPHETAQRGLHLLGIDAHVDRPVGRVETNVMTDGDLAHQGDEIDRGIARGWGARELHQFAEDAVDALRLGDDLPQRLVARLLLVAGEPVFLVRQDVLRLAADDGEGVVDLVPRPGGELGEGGQFREPQRLRLGLGTATKRSVEVGDLAFQICDL